MEDSNVDNQKKLNNIETVIENTDVRVSDNISKKEDDLLDKTNCTDNEALEKDLNITETLNNLSLRIEEMNNLFISKIQHTEYQEKIVDRMHKELQKYKEDMYSQLVRPILQDIIEVRDSILRIAYNYKNKPEGEQSIPNKVFADYALDIQDILEKNNIEIYQSSIGDTYTPVKQRVVKKVFTDDKNLHGKIAETIGNGYDYNGKTISPEKVSIYYYDKSIKDNERNEE